MTEQQTIYQPANMSSSHSKHQVQYFSSLTPIPQIAPSPHSSGSLLNDTPFILTDTRFLIKRSKYYQSVCMELSLPQDFMLLPNNHISQSSNRYSTKTSSAHTSIHNSVEQQQTSKLTSQTSKLTSQTSLLTAQIPKPSLSPNHQQNSSLITHSPQLPSSI